MVNITGGEDYIDRLSEILPLQRSFSPLEKFLIVCIVSTFVSLVGCTLLCLIFPQSPIRRRYSSKNRQIKVPRKSLLVVPPPPSYDSIIKTDEVTDFNKLSRSPYLNIPRKSSNGTVSDSDGIQLNNVGFCFLHILIHFLIFRIMITEKFFVLNRHVHLYPMVVHFQRLVIHIL